MSISGLLGRRRARTRIEYLLARTNARAGCWADHQGIYQRVCIVEVVLWTTSLTAVVVQIAAFFLLAETYGPRILGKKAHRLRKETGDLRLRTEFEAPDETIGVKLRGSLVRPFRLLGTQLVIQILSLYMAYLYGMVYLLLSTFPTLWTGVYGETTSIGSLNNISLAVGCYIGSQLAAHLNDRLYVRFQNHTGETGRPEFRVLFMAVGAFLVPAGLFVYGWTAWARTHWIGPNIGAAVFSAGVMVNFQRIQVYVVDAYQAFAASALAAIAVLRSIAGFGFPLFAPRLFETLGYEWGTSVLGFPTPALLGFYGQWLRERSKYAAG